MTAVSGNFYADTRGGYLKRGRQTTVGYSKKSIFMAFGHYDFGTIEMGPTLLYGII